MPSYGANISSVTPAGVTPGMFGASITQVYDFTNQAQKTVTFNPLDRGLAYVASIYIDNSNNPSTVTFTVAENGFIVQARPYSQCIKTFYAPQNFNLQGISGGHTKVTIILMQALMQPQDWDAIHPLNASAVLWTTTVGTTSATIGNWTQALAANPTRDKIVISADGSQTSGVLYISLGSAGGSQAISLLPANLPLVLQGPITNQSVWVKSTVASFKWAIQSTENVANFAGFVQQFTASQTINVPAGAVQAFCEMYTSGGQWPSGGSGGGGAYCSTTINVQGVSSLVLTLPNTQGGTNTLVNGATTILQALGANTSTAGTASIGTVQNSGGAGKTSGSANLSGGGCGGPNGPGGPGIQVTAPATAPGGAGGGGLAGKGADGTGNDVGAMGALYGGGNSNNFGPNTFAIGICQITWS